MYIDLNNKVQPRESEEEENFIKKKYNSIN